MSKFKLYLLIIFCIVVSMNLAGCGIVRGIGSDLSAIGEILRRV